MLTKIVREVRSANAYIAFSWNVVVKSGQSLITLTGAKIKENMYVACKFSKVTKNEIWIIQKQYNANLKIVKQTHPNCRGNRVK